MPAVRTVAHRNHALALGALQLSHRLIFLLPLHWRQLSLAHRAESHLLPAVRAGNTPVRAGEGVPFFCMILLFKAPLDKLVRTSLYRKLRVSYTPGSMEANGNAL